MLGLVFIETAIIYALLVLERFSLGQLVRCLLLQLLVIGGPLVHKLLHRLEQEEIQPPRQNGQVHPVQQDLLQIDIQPARGQLPRAGEQARHIIAKAQAEAEQSKERALRESQRELRELACW